MSQYLYIRPPKKSFPADVTGKNSPRGRFFVGKIPPGAIIYGKNPSELSLRPVSLRGLPYYYVASETGDQLRLLQSLGL